MSKKILVTGATGKLGSEIVTQLLGKVNARDIYILARDTSKAEELRLKGVNIIKGDYNDYKSLVDAFKAVDKLFFISSSDVMNRYTQHGNVIKGAVEAKVGHVFYTSAQRKSEDGTSPIAMVADAHWQTENLIKASGLTYTFLKHSLYADILPMFMGDAVFETGIYLPAQNGKVSFATRKDMAIAASIILTTNGHENKVYEISGEISYSFKEIAEILSMLSGREVSYISPTVEEFIAALKSKGLPDEIIFGVSSFCQAIANGEFDFPDTTLTRLLQRSPFVKKNPEPLQEYLKTAYNL